MTEEKKEKVVLNSEDIQNIRNFAIHFEVEMSDELKEAADKFNSKPNIENQNNLKLALCKWIKESEHDSFKDSLWDHAKERSTDIIFNMQFDKDVNEVLGSEGD
jgi:hypothetical protein